VVARLAAAAAAAPAATTPALVLHGAGAASGGGGGVGVQKEGAAFCSPLAQNVIVLFCVWEMLLLLKRASLCGGRGWDWLDDGDRLVVVVMAVPLDISEER